MESSNDNCTTRSTDNNANLTPTETDPKRILQSATSPSIWTVYRKLGIETQEREATDTLKHALAISNEKRPQDPVPTDAAAHHPLTS